MSSKISYFSDIGRNLYGIDIQSGNAFFVGNLGVQLTDLAIAPDGTAYGITFTGLYKVDLATATALFVAPLGIAGANGLAIAPTGGAYVASVSMPGIFQLSLTDGQTSLLPLSDDQNIASQGDLAIVDDKIVMATTLNSLATFDLSSGALISNVSTGIANLFGLSSFNSALIGFAQNKVYALNPSTGESNELFHFNPFEIEQTWGAHTFPNFSGKVVFGTGTSNVLQGSFEDDVIYGFGSSDTIFGFAGADRIVGGGGRDKMAGGAGRDIFDYTFASDTGKSASTRDKILDFKHGQDKIDLSDIDAKINTSTNETFKFVSAQAFHHRSGELHYVKHNVAGTSNDKTIVEGDVNGDGRADFQIELKGLIGLTKGDFIL